MGAVVFFFHQQYVVFYSWLILKIFENKIKRKKMRPCERGQRITSCFFFMHFYILVGKTLWNCIQVELEIEISTGKEFLFKQTITPTMVAQMPVIAAGHKESVAGHQKPVLQWSLLKTIVPIQAFILILLCSPLPHFSLHPSIERHRKVNSTIHQK